MQRVFRIREQGKVQKGGRRTMATVPGTESLESTVALIHVLIPLGLQAVAEALEAEVVALAGERDRRVGGQPGVVRWSHQGGSVYVADQKLPITYPRLRNLSQTTEIPLATSHQWQAPRTADDGLFRKILLGVSGRHDNACAEAVPGAFGLRPSTVSRRFIRASARHLRTLSERRLDGEECVAVVLDGKTFADDAMVLALGITRQGQKTILGVVQTATEHERVCAAFLRELVTRGLRAESGLLCLIDGAKGLRTALQTGFGRRAVVQRCQWHKREHVVTSLPKTQQAPWRRTLQAASEPPTSEQAKAALGALRKELRLLTTSAAASLDDGFEDTLTRHRLGPFHALGGSLKTTTCLESVTAQLGQIPDTVDRWRTSDQQHRGVASARLTIEPRLRRIQGSRHLSRLRTALQADIRRAETTEHTHVA